MPMDNMLTTVGTNNGLVKKHEFIRLIIQCLYSLGYKRSAFLLESESGIPYKNIDFERLESNVLDGNWEDCCNTLSSIKDLKDETRASALFSVLKQWLYECLNCGGDDSTALAVLRKHVCASDMGKEKVHRLSHGIISPKEIGLGYVDDSVISGLRNKLLIELERLLPPPFTLPQRRLEHLVERAVTTQIESCLYHNSLCEVSLYKDHSCGREQIPTETVQILTDHRNEVWFVQFSNNGNYLASSSSDCTAIIWEVLHDDSLKLKHTLNKHEKPVSFVAWSPDDKKLLTCGNMEVLKLWDVETGTCKHTFGDHSFSSCSWFPDSNRFVCGSSDPEKGIYMWDCDGLEIKAWKGMRMPKVLDLAVTPDGKNLITIFSDKEIRIVNLSTNAERVISEAHSIACLSVSADSQFFIVNLNSQEIHMWDVAGKWEKPLTYMGHKQHKYVIRSCFGGLNSAFIASGSENSQVYIWSRRNPKPIEVLFGHLMTVNSVSWNPKRPQMLASASDDQMIRIWGPNKSNEMSLNNCTQVTST